MTPDLQGIAVLVRDSQGRIAVSERLPGERSFVHMWQFAGGKMDPGDGGNPASAARRELREETGLYVIYPRLIYLGSDTRPHARDASKLYTGFAFLVDILPGETLAHTEPTKQSPWVFLAPDEIRNLRMIPGLQQYLDKALDIERES